MFISWTEALSFINSGECMVKVHNDFICYLGTQSDEDGEMFYLFENDDDTEGIQVFDSENEEVKVNDDGSLTFKDDLGHPVTLSALRPTPYQK